eukprot:6645919-Prorocentrum_lima.AAC.1
MTRWIRDSKVLWIEGASIPIYEMARIIPERRTIGQTNPIIVQTHAAAATLEHGTPWRASRYAQTRSLTPADGRGIP